MGNHPPPPDDEGKHDLRAYFTERYDPIQRQQEDNEDLGVRAKPFAEGLTPAQRQPADLQRDGSADGGSFQPGADFENRLGSLSGGKPLDSETRSFMEPRFRADLKHVRVHDGGEAAQMSSDIRAQAFTFGKNNIVMGAGKHNPGTAAGKHLLAHEITHTFQQGAGAQRTPIQRTSQTGVIQRLPTKKDVTDAGGKQSFTAWVKSSTYQQILTLLNEYHSNKKKHADKASKLQSLLPKVNKWLSEHYDSSEKTQKRQTALRSLKSSILEEMALLSDGNDEQFADVKGVPDTYKIIVGSYRKNKYYLPFQKARYEIEQTYKSKKKGLRPDDPTDIKTRAVLNQEIRSKSAEHVLSEMPEQEQPVDEDDRRDLISEIMQGGSALNIGHTWVKFISADGDQIAELDSFGFWPKGSADHPMKALEGEVRNPDDGFDQELDKGDRLYQDYQVKKEDYDKAHTKAKDVNSDPPRYEVFGYNCTKFVRQVVREAGLHFPTQADVFPYVSIKDQFIEEKAPNPDMLFSILEEKKKQENVGISQAVSNSKQEQKFKQQENASQELEQSVRDLATSTDPEAEGQLMGFVKGATWVDLSEVDIEGMSSNELLDYIASESNTSLYVSALAMGSFLVLSPGGAAVWMQNEIGKNRSMYDMFEPLRRGVPKALQYYVEAYQITLREYADNPQLAQIYLDTAGISISDALEMSMI